MNGFHETYFYLIGHQFFGAIELNGNHNIHVFPDQVCDEMNSKTICNRGGNPRNTYLAGKHIKKIMKNSAGLTLQIGDDSYGFELKQSLWEQQYDQPNHKAILAVILKLINVDLQHCEEKDLKAYFTKAELEILEDSTVIQDVGNKEVIARWNDVRLTLNKKHIKVHISSVREAYVFIYFKSKSISYLIRAIALVKYAKSIFKDELEEIFDQAKQCLVECGSAYYQQLILIELISIYGQNKCQPEFTEFLEERIVHFLSVKDFRSARF